MRSNRPCIPARSAVLRDCRPPACAHDLGYLIYFVARVGPERDARLVRLMILVFGETKKFRRHSIGFCIKRAPFTIRLFACESKRGQNVFVELLRCGKVFYAQIDVIESSFLHFFNLRSLRIINFNPDHVSSTAHTFTSTNPSGNATARTTSSVTSLTTPDDFLGHETHSVPSSAISCADALIVSPNRFDVSRRNG